MGDHGLITSKKHTRTGLTPHATQNSIPDFGPCQATYGPDDLVYVLIRTRGQISVHVSSFLTKRPVADYRLITTGTPGHNYLVTRHTFQRIMELSPDVGVQFPGFTDVPMPLLLATS